MPGTEHARRWATVGAVVAALAVGFAAGRTIDPTVAGAAGQATAAGVAAATATRSAELADPEALQTQVAESCDPVPVASPATTPTSAPPLAMGQPLPYPDNWTVTVTSATILPTVGTMPASGPFVQVGFSLVNGEALERGFPFFDLVLVTPRGQTFSFSYEASQVLESTWTTAIPPSLPTEVSVLFEVGPDAGAAFTLERRGDPSVRVELDLSVNA